MKPSSLRILSSKIEDAKRIGQMKGDKEDKIRFVKTMKIAYQQCIILHLKGRTQSTLRQLQVLGEACQDPRVQQ